MGSNYNIGRMKEINRPGNIRSLTEGRVPTGYSSDAIASSTASNGLDETVTQPGQGVNTQTQGGLQTQHSLPKQDARPAWMRAQQDGAIHGLAQQFSVAQACRPRSSIFSTNSVGRKSLEARKAPGFFHLKQAR